LRAWQADDVSDAPVPSRRLCWSLVLVGALALVALGVAFVPWAWVPGGHPVAVRADQVFTTTQIDRAETYSGLQRPLSWGGLAISVVVACLLGLTRLGARVTRALPGPWWVRAALVTFLALLVGALATAPTDLLFRRNALHYGLTQQSLGGWVHDQLVSLLVGWVFAFVTVLVVLVPARRSPRRWPLWTGLSGALLVVLGSFVYPVAVEPLFNHFTSLPDGRLRTGILQLAEEEHVHVSDVLVADASRRTTTLNAYVSGFGSTRRVVLYDNLVKDVPDREVLSVVGHELGHARYDDVLLGTVLGAAGILLGSGLAGLLLRGRLLRRAGVRGPGEPEVVPLVLAVVTVATLLSSPVQNVVSRAIEARADRAALTSTRDYPAFEKVQEQLSTSSLQDPTPPRWSQLWFGSHPTSLERIGIARALEREG
jgi:STE24 endopeptidase